MKRKREKQRKRKKPERKAEECDFFPTAGGKEIVFLIFLLLMLRQVLSEVGKSTGHKTNKGGGAMLYCSLAQGAQKVSSYESTKKKKISLSQFFCVFF